MESFPGQLNNKYLKNNSVMYYKIVTRLAEDVCLKGARGRLNNYKKFR